MNQDDELRPPEINSGDLRMPQELIAFEAQISALRPREDRLDRERLMFLAGHASARESHEPIVATRRWAWPAAFGAMTAAAAVLLVLAIRPDSNIGGPENLSAPDRDVTSVVRFEPRPAARDRGILTTGMTPSRVEQLMARSWTTANDYGGVDSDGGDPNLSVRSFGDVL
jgi:hypothetical protein